MEKRGTYRWLSLLLALVFVLGLAGCAPEGSSSSEPERESSQQEPSSESSVPEEDDGLDYGRTVYEGYQEVIDQYGLEICLGDEIKLNNLNGYCFEYDTTGEAPLGSMPFKVIFIKKWDGKELVDATIREGEFYSLYDWNRDDEDVFESFVTATFLWTDPRLTLDEAVNKTQVLVNSVDWPKPLSYSRVMESGDYLIMITEQSQGYRDFQVKKKALRWGDQDWSKYQPMEYPAVKDGSEDTPFLVEGTVKNIYPFYSRAHLLYVEDAMGNEYRMVLNYIEHMYTADVGETYRFYATIAPDGVYGDVLCNIEKMERLS